MAIIQKLETLLGFSKAVFVIREIELTRGGEIAELMFCIFLNYSMRICLLKKNNIHLTSMLDEFMLRERVLSRDYDSIENLSEIVIHILSNMLSGIPI